jgi:hypothetical protein
MAKPSAVKGKDFHKAPGENPIAAQHVRKMDIEQQGGQSGQHPVAQQVTGTIGGRVGMDAPRGEKIGPIRNHLRDHAG